MYGATQETATRIQFGDKQRRQAVVARYPNAVVGGEVAQTVCDQPFSIDLQRTWYMGAVADDQIGARVHRRTGKPDHVSAILAPVILGIERHPQNVPSLTAGMHGHDHDVVTVGEGADPGHGCGDVEQVMSALEGGESNQGHPASPNTPGGYVSIPPRMPNAMFLECLHTRVAPLLAKITGMIVGQAHHRKAGCRQVRRVAGGGPEKITSLRVRACLDRISTVHQHALQIAESHVAGGRHREGNPVFHDRIRVLRDGGRGVCRDPDGEDHGDEIRLHVPGSLAWRARYSMPFSTSRRCRSCSLAGSLTGPMRTR